MKYQISHRLLLFSRDLQTKCSVSWPGNTEILCSTPGSVGFSPHSLSNLLCSHPAAGMAEQTPCTTMPRGLSQGLFGSSGDAEMSSHSPFCKELGFRDEVLVCGAIASPCWDLLAPLLTQGAEAAPALIPGTFQPEPWMLGGVSFPWAP